VLAYIEERAGTEFEPDIAASFVRMMRKVEGGIQLSPLAPAAPAEITKRATTEGSP
jgi:hypothetical protein